MRQIMTLIEMKSDIKNFVMYMCLNYNADNSSSSQHEDEKCDEAPKQRRDGRSAILSGGHGFEGDGVQYEMQDYNKTKEYKYVRNPEIGKRRKDPGLTNVAYSPDAIDPEDPPAGRAESGVTRRKTRPLDTKYYIEEDKKNYIPGDESKEKTLANRAELGDVQDDDETVIESCHL